MQRRRGFGGVCLIFVVQGVVGASVVLVERFAVLVS